MAFLSFFRTIRNFFATILAFILGIFGLGSPGADIANLAYASQSSEQKMDIYLPSNKGEIDVMLFIHGGGWTSRDKSDYSKACKDAAKSGYAAATINYRMIDAGLPLERQSVSYRDMLDDIESAIATLKSKLISEGYTPDKLAISGISAGGHLTMLFGFSRYAQSAIPIAFLAADVGPADFTDMEFFTGNEEISLALISNLVGQSVSEQDVLNKAEHLKDASPLYFIGADVPPTLLRYGQQDKLVPFSQGVTIHNALDAAGVRNDLFIYPNSGHLLNDSKDKALNDSYLEKLKEYMNSYF